MLFLKMRLFSFFFIIFFGLSHSIAYSEPISISGINHEMVFFEKELYLAGEGYSCDGNSDLKLSGRTICRKGKNKISLYDESYDPGLISELVWFNCEVYNGCKRSNEEIMTFLLRNLPISGGAMKFIRLAYGHEVEAACFDGEVGDEICLTNDKSLVLLKGSIGESEMKL